MDGYAAAARDVADDVVAWHGVARAADARKQVADAEHLEAAHWHTRSRDVRQCRRLAALLLGAREYVPADLVGVDVAVPDRRQEIVDFVEFELAGQVVEFDAVDIQALQRFFDHLASADDVLLALLAPEPLADFFPRVSRVHEPQVGVQPIARRSTRAFGGDDLDDVAVMEPRVE